MTHLLSVNNKKFHYVPKVKSLYLFFDVEAVDDISNISKHLLFLLTFGFLLNLQVVYGLGRGPWKQDLNFRHF